MTLRDNGSQRQSSVNFPAPCQTADVPGDDQARVQAWVTKDTYRRLRLLSVDRETSVAEVVRQLLDDALSRIEEAP